MSFQIQSASALHLARPDNSCNSRVAASKSDSTTVRGFLRGPSHQIGLVHEGSCEGRPDYCRNCRKQASFQLNITLKCLNCVVL